MKSNTDAAQPRTHDVPGTINVPDVYDDHGLAQGIVLEG
jgi:hypothetical protein